VPFVFVPPPLVVPFVPFVPLPPLVPFVFVPPPLPVPPLPVPPLPVPPLVVPLPGLVPPEFRRRSRWSCPTWVEFSAEGRGSCLSDSEWSDCSAWGGSDSGSATV